MNNEAKLLSKVIEERSIGLVLERGINEEWFADANDKKIFTFVHDHYSKYQESPSIEVVVDNFPTYELLYVEDTIDYFIDRLVENRRKISIIRTLDSAITSLDKDKDHEGALIAMERGLIRLEEEGLTQSNDLEITREAANVLTEYEYRKKNPGMLGLATGFPTIDLSTSGLQPEQLVVIVAPPKTGKSQIALQMAVNVHKAGMVPMFQSFEMNNHEQSQRHDSMRAHISNARLRRGKLQTTEEARYKKMLSYMEQAHPFHLVDAVNGLTIDSLLAKAEQLNPDILFVDGVYLMLDQVTGEANTPQALTNITRGLKRVAQRLNIPIVITTQTLLWKMKGGKVSADSIGYSSSFFQDSDVILGLEPVDGDESVRLLKVVQARNCPPSETSITWNWDTGCFHDETAQASCKFCVPWSMP